MKNKKDTVKTKKDIRNFKYRLYPTKDQIKTLKKIMFYSKNIYNFGIMYRESKYRFENKTDKARFAYPLFAECRNSDIELKKYFYADSACLIFTRVDQTYNAFFKNIKTKTSKKYGSFRPKFKSYKTFNTVPYRRSGFKIIDNPNPDAKRFPKLLRLYGVDSLIKIRYHRDIPVECTIKQALISRKNDKWFVCFSLETELDKDDPSNRPDVGIDVGIKTFLTFSDGHTIDIPKYYKDSQDERKKKQRRVNKKRAWKGRYTNNQKKRLKIVKKFDEHIYNQRDNYLHEITTYIERTYNRVVIEDMPYKFMQTFGRWSKPDLAFSKFKLFLEYKLGDRLILVDPKNTSRMCSNCGNVKEGNEFDLSIRTYKCEICGLEMDRDLNAAINIERSANLV